MAPRDQMRWFTRGCGGLAGLALVSPSVGVLPLSWALPFAGLVLSTGGLAVLIRAEEAQHALVDGPPATAPALAPVVVPPPEEVDLTAPDSATERLGA